MLVIKKYSLEELEEEATLLNGFYIWNKFSPFMFLSKKVIQKTAQMLKNSIDDMKILNELGLTSIQNVIFLLDD